MSDYADRLYSELLQEQNSVQQLLKADIDEKIQRIHEKNLMLINAMMRLLVRYAQYQSKKET